MFIELSKGESFFFVQAFNPNIAVGLEEKKKYA
jgi:hypothetical protein